MSGRQKVQYQANVMERVGGDSMFEFILIEHVENLKNDPKLDVFFGNFPTEDLLAHQKQFLIHALAQHPEDFDLDSYIELRFFNLIQRGFDRSHYNALMVNLVKAMADGWVDDDDTIRDVLFILKSYRRLFEDSVSTGVFLDDSIRSATESYISEIKDTQTRFQAATAMLNPSGNKKKGHYSKLHPSRISRVLTSFRLHRK